MVLMPFPFLGKYLWGEGKGIAARHFRTAKREHEDLSEMAQIFNLLAVDTVPESERASLERNGTAWTIKIPGKAAINEPETDPTHEPTTITLLTDVRFDPTTNQLQKKTITFIFAGDSTESPWTLISGGQAKKCP